MHYSTSGIFSFFVHSVISVNLISQWSAPYTVLICCSLSSYTPSSPHLAYIISSQSLSVSSLSPFNTPLKFSRVAEWYAAGLATSPIRIPPVAAAVYRCQLSVPSLRGRLMSTSEKRACRAMHWAPIRGLAASAGVRLRAKETGISVTPWALRLGKGLYFTSFHCRRITHLLHKSFPL